MKTVVTFQVFILVVISTFCQEEVLGQSFYPPYGGVPIVYDNSEDNDIGLLLTVLLLAARNRNGNCNCCNCCNCGNAAKTVPIPYPIAFPTNNPAIYKAQYGYQNSYDNDDDGGDDNGNNDNNGNNGNGYFDYKDSGSSLQTNSGVSYDKNVTWKLVPAPIESNDDNNSLES